MLDGKIYEVIILTDLALDAHNAKKSMESYLEGILNEYAKEGYKIAGIWKDIIFMENFKVK